MPEKIKKISRIFAFAVLIAALLLFAIAGHAIEVPDLKGRVNDYAGMLSTETKSILETKLVELEKSDSTQLAILTIASLEGDAIENFSIRVAEKWKIGHKKLDNGVILLISKNDRKLRIEVGYGLEGKLTDLVSGRIIRDIIAPNFKKGNFDQGVIDGVNAITSVVRGEFSAKDAEGKKDDNEGFFSKNIVYVIIFVLFFLGAAGAIKRIFAGILGAVVFPVAGLIALPFTLWLLLLIPAGFLTGMIITSILSGIGRGGGGGFFGGHGGGFSSFSDSSSSDSSFGGFDGGGGSFGGGGASGDW